MSASASMRKEDIKLERFGISLLFTRLSNRKMAKLLGFQKDRGGEFKTSLMNPSILYLLNQSNLFRMGCLEKWS